MDFLWQTRTALETIDCRGTYGSLDFLSKDFVVDSVRLSVSIGLNIVVKFGVDLLVLGGVRLGGLLLKKLLFR